MDNKDLVWDLEHFQKRKRAQEFVLGFENKLCIYSGSVSQLYTNYNIFFPQDEGRKLVVLPNPYAHHDTFQGIGEACVKPTGLFIVPGDVSERSLALILPLKSGNNRRVPLEVGISLINSKMKSGKDFLPVIMKGDLRELDANTPCLHLNMLNLSSLEDLSVLEIRDIRRVVLDRLEELAKRR